MAIICPACNKANQTEAACSRCGCDLRALHAVLEGAQATLCQAKGALGEADWAGALGWAQRSWELCHTVEAARLAFIAAAASGQTQDALGWRQRALGAGESAASSEC